MKNVLMMAIKGMVIKKFTLIRQIYLVLEVEKGGKQKKSRKKVKKGCFNSFFLKKVNFSVLGDELLPPSKTKSKKTTFWQCLRQCWGSESKSESERIRTF